MRFSSFLRRTIRTFAETTSVDGIGQVIRAVHWSESIFWSVALIGGIYLTCRDCSAPISGYLDEASVSTTDFISNKTISFPGSSLCIEVDTTKLAIENRSALEDAERVRSFCACLRSPKCVNATGFYDTFADEIFAASKLLSYYSAAEGGKDRQIEAVNASVKQVPSTFYYGLVEAQISSAQLARTLGYALCKRMQIEVHFWRRAYETVYDFCATASVLWFGIPAKTFDEVDTLCFGIENFTHFSSKEDNYELYFYPHHVMPKGQKQFAYFNAESVPIITDLSSSYSSVPFDTCVLLRLELSQRITLLSKRARPCDSQRPYFECLGRCRVRDFAMRCNCSSVSWQLYIGDEIDPNWLNVSCFAHYAPGDFWRCELAVSAVQTGRQPCSERCYQKCENDMVSVTAATLPCEQERGYEKATAVMYRIGRLSYVYVEEKLAYDFPSLVSNIGGIVGLWLGAGFIGLIELVVFLPKAFVEYAARRGGTTATLEKEACSNDKLEHELVKFKADVISCLGEFSKRLDFAVPPLDDRADPGTVNMASL